MGRKALYAEKAKKGPGRKAKKQGEPRLTRKFKASEDDKDDTKLSHRQKQRQVKRVKKQEVKRTLLNNQQKKTQKNKTPKKPYNSDSDDNDDSEEDDEIEVEQQKVEESEPETESEELEGVEEEELENESAEDESEIENGVEDEEESDDGDLESESESEDFERGEEKDLLDEDDSENSNDDDDDDDDDDEDEDEDDNDEDDLLPIEKAAKKLKARKEQDARLADEEMKMGMENQEVFVFPDEEDESEDKPVTLAIVQQRIKDVMLVLSDFNKYRQPNRSRQEYLDLLRKDLCTYYSYNGFLMERFMQIFPINELMEFLEASETQRPLTIRTNSLKTRRRDLATALINRGVNLDPLGKWTKVGLVIYNSQVPLGATPEYLAGHYMIQGASSMLPVMALAPKENERILDLCAAPGGKSSHIAAIMKNTGILFSNDANKDRIKAVVGNFHRLGVINAVVSCEDGCKYNKIMTGFDRILVDAPCTGTGVIAKDPSVKTSKSDVDIQRCYNLQRKLLLTAIDCLSAKSPTGGYLVYSTCSIMPEENEWVIDYALKKRNVKLVPTGLEFGTEGFVNYRQFRFHPSMNLTRRYYPHTHNMDGFFVAKFKKFSDVIPATAIDDENIDENAETFGNENGTANDENSRDKKKRSAADVAAVAAKKKKQEEEQKKYVAKVFEPPVKIPATTKQVTNEKHTKNPKATAATAISLNPEAKKLNETHNQSQTDVSPNKSFSKKQKNQEKRKSLGKGKHQLNGSSLSSSNAADFSPNANKKKISVNSEKVLTNGKEGGTDNNNKIKNKNTKQRNAHKTTKGGEETSAIIKKAANSLVQKQQLNISNITPRKVTKIKNKMVKKPKKQIGKLKKSDKFKLSESF